MCICVVFGVGICVCKFFNVDIGELLMIFGVELLFKLLEFFYVVFRYYFIVSNLGCLCLNVLFFFFIFEVEVDLFDVKEDEEIIIIEDIFFKKVVERFVGFGVRKKRFYFVGFYFFELLFS